MNLKSDQKENHFYKGLYFLNSYFEFSEQLVWNTWTDGK